jgi:hypothetical protein
MKEPTEVRSELLYVFADDSFIVPYRGTVRDGLVVSMEYDAPTALMEALQAPLASEVHEAIMREAKA